MSIVQLLSLPSLTCKNMLSWWWWCGYVFRVRFEVCEKNESVSNITTKWISTLFLVLRILQTDSSRDSCRLYRHYSCVSLYECLDGCEQSVNQRRHPKRIKCVPHDEWLQKSLKSIKLISCRGKTKQHALNRLDKFLVREDLLMLLSRRQPSQVKGYNSIQGPSKNKKLVSCRGKNKQHALRNRPWRKYLEGPLSPWICGNDNYEKLRF